MLLEEIAQSRDWHRETDPMVYQQEIRDKRISIVYNL